jgi:4,5-DOPA dioxygenase extradiol
MIPSLFVSHGSPMLALTDTPARQFLVGLGSSLRRPQAIIVVSAHWETPTPMVNAVARNTTIHDFHGFPPELYTLDYAPPGDPTLAARIASMLTGAGLTVTIDRQRGLDHGAWVPLLIAYPDAAIPVLQISVQPHAGPAHHYAVGQALAPLRADDVLIIGSGSFTHDLRRFRGQAVDAPESPDVTAFAAWMDQAIHAHDLPALLAYRTRAPFARDQHPTEEHLLPLYTALGAGGGTATRLHRSAEHSILRMDAYAFGDPR